ncbi:hypothetical protein [Flavivirga sp. 57AJ16]|uniref:hypothetical protein n=1 Tax=Flavivirga sp. 57AJ16 TaxID=3025307 RepID=UPI0023655024|nr:hypothetical protein [Flavivirga sp. 57AJ16]MDD7887856.1 hypothetical protein [Flavivirga sp. 57AJ16]
MEEQTKVDKDYIESFNQGYEVAKELGLKPDSIEGIKAGNNRMQGMKDGMEQYGKELTQEKEKQIENRKDIIPPLDIESLDNHYVDLTPDRKDKNKDRDMEL